MLYVRSFALREAGARLSREAIRATERHGWLCLRDHREKGQPEPWAALCDHNGAAVRTLAFARVKTIERGGLLLTGHERTVGNAPYKQTWWCEPLPPPTDRPPPAVPPSRHAF